MSMQHQALVTGAVRFVDQVSLEILIMTRLLNFLVVTAAQHSYLVVDIECLT